MMDLAFRHNDYYKKRDVEVECAAVCLSTHSFSKRACAHNFVHTPHARYVNAVGGVNNFV
jgi:hypothetical protein